ncbi:HPP family protein [Halobacteria archaeon AArc-m2/3/4]|uniref:HPP family protein n=1 Tax=Natronoglomus mannanivorans TaxID=2979990 RepID=A0AAP3E193_9EURY|nr:HPP family protein [Halobacteria archaeon AArc-xg1-1]MCU4972499.1 HPP family protein [Halobacteria archaeon AArc-m2/3/4]
MVLGLFEDVQEGEHDDQRVDAQDQDPDQKRSDSPELEVRDEYSAGINVFLHFSVLGVIAVVSGQPFLFPSLGPSAYLMATGEQPREEGAYHVVGGHAVAVVAGLIAYGLFAGDTSTYELFDQADPAFSMDLVRLSVSATAAMVITTVAMLVTKTNHPAACATTLIIALGLMGGLADAVIIVVAVAILMVFHDRVLSSLAKRYGFKPRDARE